jgi:hypothetical protein
MNKQGAASMNEKLNELNRLQSEISEVDERMKASHREPPSDKWALACKQNAAEMRDLLDKYNTLQRELFPHLY